MYKVYYQLLVSKTQIALEDSNITRAAKLLHDTRVMNENGFAEKLDVDKANVQLTNLQTARQNTATSIINGFTSLKFLIGIPAADSIVLTTQFSEATLTGGVSIDTAYSYKNRYDYQYLEIQKQLNDFDIKRYQAAYYPTLSLNGGYQKNAASNTYDLFSEKRYLVYYFLCGSFAECSHFEGFAKNARLAKSQTDFRAHQGPGGKSEIKYWSGSGDREKQFYQCDQYDELAEIKYANGGIGVYTNKEKI